MRTRIWMPLGELIGKVCVIIVGAIVIARSPIADAPGLENLGLAIFAFIAVFTVVLLAYELTGRAIGLLFERVVPSRADGTVRNDAP